jgi:hypothetical protein
MLSQVYSQRVYNVSFRSRYILLYLHKYLSLALHVLKSTKVYMKHWVISFPAMEDYRNKSRFLYGESMGGAVALLLHRKDPTFWDGAVLVAPMCKVLYHTELP